GLGVRAGDQVVADGLDVVGDAVEEVGPRGGGQRAVGAERLPRGRARAVDVVVGAVGEGGLEFLAGARVDAADRGSGAGDSFACDDHASGGGAHADSLGIREISSSRSFSSSSVRSVSGGRTGPAGRPMAFMPALTMLTAYPALRLRMSQ